jgi:hypothetical protein
MKKIPCGIVKIKRGFPSKQRAREIPGRKDRKRKQDSRYLFDEGG